MRLARARMREGTAEMYVRRWKDIDMVATSDSNPSGSTPNDEPDGTTDAEASVPSGTPAEAEPSNQPTAGAPPTESPRSAPPATDSPVRTRARRNRPSVSRAQVRAAVNGVRERLAAIVWIVAVAFAVILAAGALLIALDANPNNELVEQLIDWARNLDGPFFNLFTFQGDNAETKHALVNWGLAAAAWLVGGKIVSAIIRP